MDGPLGPRARVVAFYLPQFHPIPENDEWWGPGFTEWTNVASARPLFRGHEQPRLLGRLGFYDLRLPEVRDAQAALATAAGIEGFCYWHYWFGDGRTILERPLQEMVTSGAPLFPFCLGWGNQSWTGVWHGVPGRVLVDQRYPGANDVEAHFEHLLPALRDTRYVRIGGCLLFHVQSPHDLPKELDWPGRWRALGREAGVGEFMLTGESTSRTDPRELGFDAWVRSPAEVFPHRRPVKGRMRTAVDRRVGVVRRARYRTVMEAYAGRDRSPYPEVPAVLTGWDNTPRSGRQGIVLTDVTIEDFAWHVRSVFDEVVGEPFERRLVFLKSWNEWAEGNYLEPDWQHQDRLLATFAEVCRGSATHDP